MAGFSQFELQKSLYVLLNGDSTLMAQISGVYDRVTEGTAYPYVTIGEILGRDWSSKTTTGMQLRVTLHVYSRTGGRKETAAIMDRIHTLLHQGSLTLTGHALIMMRFDESEIGLEADGLTYHGIIRFRVLTEAV